MPLVHTANYPKELELGALSTAFGLEQTEYNPTKFSGVVYQPERFNGTFVIFRTGNTIYTGSSDSEDISDAFHYLFDKIDGLFE